MVGWSCNCVLCRVFVHPLLKRFAAPQVSEEAVAEELASLPQQVQEAVPPPPVVDVNGIKEAVAEHISLLVDSKLKDFSSRIDAVENEVKKIREEVAKSIDEVKASLVDIRAAVAEVMNPFNFLRTYSKTAASKGSLSANHIIESFEKALEKFAKRGAAEAGAEATLQEAQKGFEELSKELVSKTGSRLGLAGLIKLIKWVDDMLNRVPKEVIEDIARFMKAVGVIDDEEEKVVVGVTDFVFRARKLGLKVNEQIIYVYNLAKVFGIEDKGASEEVLKLAVEQ
jgi:hypothetical protein